MVGEGGASGKSTPNWSRMEEGGGERGSTGDYNSVQLNESVTCKSLTLFKHASFVNIGLWFCVCAWLFVYICGQECEGTWLMN